MPQPGRPTDQCDGDRTGMPGSGTPGSENGRAGVAGEFGRPYRTGAGSGRTASAGGRKSDRALSGNAPSLGARVRLPDTTGAARPRGRYGYYLRGVALL